MVTIKRMILNQKTKKEIMSYIKELNKITNTKMIHKIIIIIKISDCNRTVYKRILFLKIHKSQFPINSNLNRIVKSR